MLRGGACEAREAELDLESDMTCRLQPRNRDGVCPVDLLPAHITKGRHVHHADAQGRASYLAEIALIAAVSQLRLAIPSYWDARLIVILGREQASFNAAHNKHTPRPAITSFPRRPPSPSTQASPHRTPCPQCIEAPLCNCLRRANGVTALVQDGGTCVCSVCVLGNNACQPGSFSYD